MRADLPSDPARSVGPVSPKHLLNGSGSPVPPANAETDRPDVTTDPFKLSYDYEREKARRLG